MFQETATVIEFDRRHVVHGLMELDIPDLFQLQCCHVRTTEGLLFLSIVLLCKTLDLNNVFNEIA